MKLYLIKTENGYLIGATASDLALAFTEKGECGTYRSLPYPPHNPTWIEMPDEEKRTYALDYLKALGENYEWRELLDRTYGDKELVLEIAQPRRHTSEQLNIRTLLQT